MKKLSKAQSIVVRKMANGARYSSYDLQCKISTLDALVNKGIMNRYCGRGSMFCPRTSIKYALIPTLQEIAHLLQE